MNSPSEYRKRVVSIEDDDSYAALIAAAFVGWGHECVNYRDGRTFLERLPDEVFDLLLVDWELPDMTGDVVIARIRTLLGKTPRVMVISSRIEQDVIAAALEAGADDYISKPIRIPELLARAGALMRRKQERMLCAGGVIECGRYRLNPMERVASLDDIPVSLSPREFDLALLLFRNAGCLLSREIVMQAVWGKAGDAGSRTLDMHMSRVRTKLALRAENGVRLRSIYAHGVRLEPLHTGAGYGN